MRGGGQYERQEAKKPRAKKLGSEEARKPGSPEEAGAILRVFAPLRSYRNFQIKNVNAKAQRRKEENGEA